MVKSKNSRFCQNGLVNVGSTESDFRDFECKGYF